MSWAFYLISLIPALGLVQVGNQAAADRFTYLPSIGPFLLFSFWSAGHLPGRKFWVATATAALLLGSATFQRVHVWKDTVTLWEDVLKVRPRNNLIVYQNLGRAYEDAGRWEEALAQYNNAIVPDYPFPLAHWGKARVYLAQGRLDQAVEEYMTALTMDLSFPPLHSGLGMVYEKKGMRKEALKEIEEALKMDPNYPEAYNDLGLLYKGRGQWKEAAQAFQRAHALNPDEPSYLRELLGTYRALGQFHQALALYRGLSDHPRSLLTSNF